MGMKKIIIIVVLFVLFGFSLKAQHVLEITIEGVSRPIESTLVYWGSMKPTELKVDSLHNGKVSFNVPAYIHQNVLSVVLRGLPQLKELRIFYTGEDIKLNIHFQENSQSIVVTGTGETPLYYSSLLKLQEVEARIKSYRELLGGYKGSDELMSSAKQYYKKEIALYDSLYLNINQHYDGTLFCHVLNSLRYHFPDVRKSDGEQRQEVLDHYYDYFNPADTILLQSSFYMYKLEDFLNMIISLPSLDKNENLIREVTRYFEKMNSSEESVHVVAFLMQNWLNNRGYDKTNQYIDENILSQGCSAGNDVSLQARLRAYKLLAPGNKAPEFSWLGEDNASVSLYSINSDYTLLLFWATWCPHCQTVLPELYQYLKGKSNCKVIAIGLDDDLPSWQQAIKSYPSWIHIQAPGQWNNDRVKLYGISSTPTLFLLDKDHVIIKKVKDLDDLKKLVQS